MYRRSFHRSWTTRGRLIGVSRGKHGVYRLSLTISFRVLSLAIPLGSRAT